MTCAPNKRRLNWGAGALGGGTSLCFVLHDKDHKMPDKGLILE